MAEARSRTVELLTLVHERPGITRADAARSLGIGTGLATELTARLIAGELIDERRAEPSGVRGRPTALLIRNRRGPVVICAAIDHESWRVSAVELGGHVDAIRSATHDHDPVATLAAVDAAVRATRRRYGRRVCALGISVPGTAREGRVLQAANLGWRDVDLTGLRLAGPSRPLIVGNDASFAAVAEARRGAAVGADVSLHLYFDAGLGGAIVEAGRAVGGATGVAGEFGHLPFGDSEQPCACGAYGCWNTQVNGSALARALGAPTPRDEVSFSRRVIAAARAGDASAQAAVDGVARAIGRGSAGLVNALDPSVVTLGGLGRELLAVSARSVQDAYELGLMNFRRTDPPPLIPAALGDDAPLIGAAEECFFGVLSDEGLAAWLQR